MTREQLAQNIYDVSHITGTFVLRSGNISNEYFDKYQFESDPALLMEIGKQMAEYFDFTGVELLAGLEVGGIPIAVAISLHTKIPMVFVRKEPKKYGTARLSEGPEIKGKNVLIIEDVVSSGGQIILSTNDLRKMGANINAALCVIDRQMGGSEKLSESNIRLTSLFTMSEIKSLTQ